MKEIKCSARTKKNAIHIGCFIVMIALIGSMMLINIVLWIFMLPPGIYLIFLLLEYFHVQITVDENGIEYKNCFNL